MPHKAGGESVDNRSSEGGATPAREPLFTLKELEEARKQTRQTHSAARASHSNAVFRSGAEALRPEIELPSTVAGCGFAALNPASAGPGRCAQDCEGWRGREGDPCGLPQMVRTHDQSNPRTPRPCFCVMVHSPAALVSSLRSTEPLLAPTIAPRSLESAGCRRAGTRT